MCKYKHDAGSSEHERRSVKHDAGSSEHERRSVKHDAGSSEHERRSVKPMIDRHHKNNYKYRIHICQEKILE
ncbi:hypothetical protein FACS1894172_16940 [Spirochaetia bacterium]|nr:hypothetical protein FACS1894164_08970 [Spirochaetia bacterium]GHU35311.1 hypothetical protein FACS1894172_16940 [Spirochaetia bacterium]